MIFCLIFIVVAVVFLIGQYITSKYKYQANNYTKDDFNKVKDQKIMKRMEREFRLYKLTSFTKLVFGEADFDYGRHLLAWIIVIVFSIILAIGVYSDASKVTVKNAKYDSYKTQIEKGYIWETQESIAAEQRYIAGLKAFVHEYPILTFYKAKDIDALYDKVMTFEIPEVENTYKFKTSTRRIIEDSKED